MATLVGASGSVDNQRYEVGAELVVGRDGQSLTVDDPEMSRRHAVLRGSPDGLTIEDLGSRNGTFVNGQRISSIVRLTHGDTVLMGTTSFRVDDAAAAKPPHAPAAAAAASPLAQEPSQPFGALAAGNVAGRPRRAAASRQLLPQLIAILAVISTAVLLVLYFALR